MKRLTVLWSIGALSVVFIAVGIAVLLSIPVNVFRGVSEAVVLSNGSETLRKWADPPYDMLLQFWFFNVTNPSEVLFNGAKPALVQCGPYSYVNRQQKRNLNFASNNTVQYRLFQSYHFSEERSCKSCRETDLILVPHVPYWSVVHRLRNSPIKKTIKRLADMGLTAIGEEPFTTQTVALLLFKGYEDPVFKLGNMISWLFPNTYIPLKMGFFYGKNATLDEPVSVRTGIGDFSRVGQIVSVNGNTSVNFWRDRWSNMINGTDGTIYPPFLTRSSRLPVYAMDLCRVKFFFRSMEMEYESDTDVAGIPAYRFAVPASSFNSSLADNAGFCWPTDIFYPDLQKPDSDGRACLPSGLLNVSKCKNNAPIVISSPHFLYSEDEVVHSVIGLKPDVQEHGSYIDIEPTTGVGLVFQQRLQINVALVNDEDFS
ncbi:unnamed protein product [Soboliphyme baturini]|uniref:Lysosome membrane protein 2 n=1 Tax=Soboliphyme baturini TaxID=241478 RepID=A0A183IQ50_9BILA|nr:unnamed protein product [Soboliphyme baturini]